MRTADRAMYFDPCHTIADVACFAQCAFIDRRKEARPTGAGIKLCGATEQRRITANTTIQTGLLIVVVWIGKGPLGALFTGDLILNIRQPLLPFGIAA